MNRYRILLVGIAVTLQFFWLTSPHANEAGAAATDEASAFINSKWTGDLDGMIERRLIRLLVVYSKTHYFIDKGNQYGITYEMGKALEEEINKKYKTGKLPVHVVFVPVSRSELLHALVEGRGDIAAANLTVTPKRKELVDFTNAGRRNVSEIVISGPESPEIKSLEGLGGQQVYVRLSSSYHESLQALNKKLKQKGKPEVVIKPAPENLEDEDLLEMLNAGLIKFVIVDKHLGEFWARVLPKIKLHPELAIHEGGEIAAAIRKNSPLLAAEINKFLKTRGQGTLFGNVIFNKYLKNINYVKNAASEEERKKFLALIDLFKKYGEEYGLDWVLMAAEGYQESRLDHSVKSPAGAIGIMQIIPSTGEEMQVGNIRQVEPNIHAGVKYIRYMIDQYYKNEPMDDLNKMLFAIASYNAGPAKIRKLRAEAEQQGYDPNLWFGNVENVVADRIGRETVNYVSNIFKYYIAYQNVIEELEKRKAASEQMR